MVYVGTQDLVVVAWEVGAQQVITDSETVISTQAKTAGIKTRFGGHCIGHQDCHTTDYCMWHVAGLVGIWRV